jgi:formylglycine-generating enzyme required for sulfatase activity
MLNKTIRRLYIAAILCAAAFLSVPALAQDGGARYALVIGNGNYVDFGKLANPVNDATDIAASLKNLGFQVSLYTDATRRQMNQALNDFHDKLAQNSSSAGFFWYAGHGIQSKGENYLLPVGAQIKREADLDDEAVSARKVSALLDDARNRVNVVVMDACRNNPIPSLGRGGSRGLTVVSAAPAESMIMYSTGAGQVAADGAGRNSPFAQAFLKYMAQGGDITATIKAITAETKRLTNGEQIPYLYSSLTVDFALNPKASSALAASANLSTPSVTMTKSYGGLAVSVATAGELYVDGMKVGDLSAGGKARLGNIEAGERSVEIRYADGKVEMQKADVGEAQEASVSFVYKKTARQPTPVLSLESPRPGFVLVPGGTFTMGSPPAEPGRYGDEEQHQVTLSPFAISINDLTFDEYDEYCAATHARKPMDEGWGRGDRPVINVSWLDAVAYCNWRSKKEHKSPAYTIKGKDVDCNWRSNGYRLPTEAEWEFAAKGVVGTTDQASAGGAMNAAFAGSSDVGEAAWYADNSGNQTHPVGQKAPNGFGLYDMAGNVWQWCWDFHGNYTLATQTDPRGPSHGFLRICRGGSWILSPGSLRSSMRGNNDPGIWNNRIGFRVVFVP